MPSLFLPVAPAYRTASAIDGSSAERRRGRQALIERARLLLFSFAAPARSQVLRRIVNAVQRFDA